MKICLGDGVAPDLECFQGSFGHNVDDGSQAQRFLDGGIRIWHDGQCILAHLGATLTDHLQQSFVKSTICIADNYNRPDIFVRAGAGGGRGGGEARQGLKVAGAGINYAKLNTGRGTSLVLQLGGNWGQGNRRR